MPVIEPVNSNILDFVSQSKRVDRVVVKHLVVTGIPIFLDLSLSDHLFHLLSLRPADAVAMILKNIVQVAAVIWKKLRSSVDRPTSIHHQTAATKNVVPLYIVDPPTHTLHVDLPPGADPKEP